MKKTTCIGMLAILVSVGSWLALKGSHAQWLGVDETVVGKFADEAGRPARKPYINTDQGDLLLFVFLLAGAGGGFIGGYCYRELFVSKGRDALSNV